MNSRMPFHHQRPEFLCEQMTRDEAAAGLCVLDALFNTTVEPHGELYEYFNGFQGAYETRDEALALGTAIERAYKTLADEDGADCFADRIHDRFGCYDFEFIPAMVVAWVENPNIDFVEHIRAALATEPAE